MFSKSVFIIVRLLKHCVAPICALSWPSLSPMFHLFPWSSSHMSVLDYFMALSMHFSLPGTFPLLTFDLSVACLSLELYSKFHTSSISWVHVPVFLQLKVSFIFKNCSELHTSVIIHQSSGEYLYLYTYWEKYTKQWETRFALVSETGRSTKIQSSMKYEKVSKEASRMWRDPSEWPWGYRRLHWMDYLIWILSNKKILH